jgi:hypothetical protein
MDHYVEDPRGVLSMPIDEMRSAAPVRRFTRKRRITNIDLIRPDKLNDLTELWMVEIENMPTELKKMAYLQRIHSARMPFNEWCKRNRMIGMMWQQWSDARDEAINLINREDASVGVHEDWLMDTCARLGSSLEIHPQDIMIRLMMACRDRHQRCVRSRFDHQRDPADGDREGSEEHEVDGETSSTADGDGDETSSSDASEDAAQGLAHPCNLDAAERARLAAAWDATPQMVQNFYNLRWIAFRRCLRFRHWLLKAMERPVRPMQRFEDYLRSEAINPLSIAPYKISDLFPASHRVGHQP